jgi:wyosine [tRNA(Phe)-imidazoG37] synthetase (radical SAM superfamily)
MQAIQTQKDITPVSNIINELKAALIVHPNIDSITLTANGEPTMYPYLDELIDEITLLKGELKTLILSNSATLNDPKVFNTLLKLDHVKLSLDAATPEVFTKIDRPHKSIHIEDIIQAIQEFSHIFQGKLFIEILFVKGLNDTPSEVTALNAALAGVVCERIDIGTIDRPPAYPVEGLSFSELFEISHHFDSSLPIHIVSRTHTTTVPSSYSREDILITLDKRPLTPDDVQALFDETSKEVLEKLLDEGKITQIERSNVLFYINTENKGRKRSKTAKKS